MTREVIGSVFLGVWLGCIAATAGQLPPEIQVDRYLLRADRLMEAKDPKGALEVMGKIVALQKEHGLTLPEEFHFKHAKVAFSAGEVQEAVDAVHTYLLKAGREGKFYREALELLDEAEQREQLQAWIGNEQTCAGQPKGAECWKELTGQPGCYVWDNYLITDQTVTWTGTCSERAGPRGGNAQVGLGRWRENVGIYGKPHRRQESRPVGHSRSGRDVWERRQEARPVGGRRPLCGRQEARPVGLREADGDVWEGPYVDGKRHGPWVSREADTARPVGGALYGRNCWRRPLVDGKLHGQWVARNADGGVHEGPYVDGKRHGPWVARNADGGVLGRPLCGRQAARPVGGALYGRNCWRRPLGGRQEARPVGGALGGRRCPGRPLCGRQEARPVGAALGGRNCWRRPLCGRQESRPVGLAPGGRKSRACDL